MWRRRQLIFVAAFVVVLAGCGGTDDSTAKGPPPVACAEIGCTSGVFLNVEPLRRKLPSAERVKVCLRRRCHTYALAKVDLVNFSVRGLREGQRVGVRLVAMDKRGAAVLRRRARAPVRKVRPNGPQCPPTCFQVAVRLDPKTLRLVVPG
jgi:hypothetical protein